MEKWVGEPDWSPDGEQIVFTVCTGTEFTDCDLYTISPNTKVLQNLTSTFEHNVSSPIWSPTTQSIAFKAYDKALTTEILQTLDLQTMKFTSVAESEYIGSFQYSPDGNKIAFSSTENRGWDIYVADADGNNKVNLTNNQGQIQEDAGYGLDWSPDGNQIVYSAGPFEGYFQLFIMNSDGSKIHRLTQIQYHLTDPRWVVSQ